MKNIRLFWIIIYFQFAVAVFASWLHIFWSLIYTTTILLMCSAMLIDGYRERVKREKSESFYLAMRVPHHIDILYHFATTAEDGNWWLSTLIPDDTFMKTIVCHTNTRLRVNGSNRRVEQRDDCSVVLRVNE